MKPIKFPEDELAHKNTIEWWYFNGHLEDKNHNKYSFMNCLFKADPKKIEIRFLNKIPLKAIYFSHSILSDIKNKNFYPNVDYVSIVSKDSFSKPLLFINYTKPVVLTGYINSVIEETDKFKYRVKTENMDLELTSVKKPLLEGGSGYVDLHSKKTYYYSLTNLKTEGVIRIKNKLIQVKGKSWMDHQWANVTYPDKWNWFSIQLDNDTEIVCFEYDDGKDKTYLASISHPNDKQEHTNEVRFTPIGMEWTSPKTKTKYPLSWRIEIPSKNIDLEVKPLIENQEMIFGTIRYWEGPLTVSGKFNNKKVKGVGFLELVGRQSHYTNLKFYKNKLAELAVDVSKLPLKQVQKRQRI